MTPPPSADSQSLTAPPPAREPLRSLTAAVGLVLVVLVAAGGAYAALARYDLVGLGHLPRVAVFALALVLVANAVAAWLRRRRIFSRAQLGYIYIAIVVMAGFPGQQLVTYLYLGLLGPAYYATPENRYRQTFFDYIPRWMVPSKDHDAPVIKWAFEGVPAGASLPWHPWVTPLLAWTPFLLALLALQLCVAALLRRRWAEEEQLTFPLARIPVELMTHDSPSQRWPDPCRRAMFWLAFSIPVVIQSFYALRQYFPQLPYLDLNRNIGAVFAARPWNELNYLPYAVYFGVVGITALIPTDIGFSLWFFWIVRRLMVVARSALGYEPQGTFFDNHGMGAYVFLGMIYLWMARGSFARAAGSAAPASGASRRAEGEARDPIPPRYAFWGVIASLAVIMLWGGLAGAHAWFVLAMMLLWIAAMVVVARLVSEAGIVVVWAPTWQPQSPLLRALGVEAVGPRTVTLTSFMGWKLNDSASCTMASVLQGYRVGNLVRGRPRAVFWFAAAALVVALFVSHPASLETIYRLSVPKLGWWPRGAADSVPNTINNLITSPRPYQLGDYGNMASGASVILVLQALRLRFPMFPLSPLAYAWVTSPGWAGDRYGFSVFLGWAMKFAVVRGGGWRGFEALRYAALGIIVGDAVVLSLWTVARYVFPLGEALIIE
jgi:hypothetical protein